MLGARLLMDANGNRTAVAYDALGLLTGTAVMGPPPPAPVEGDSLDDFAADLSDAQVAAALETPLADPHAILASATSRLVYDLLAYVRTRDTAQPSPVVSYTLARETHAADLATQERPRIHHAFAYSDGFGRVIQRKTRAEPGPVPVRGADGRIILDADGQPIESAGDVAPRWIGTGWTVFNNKGLPVRQYEPFFSDTHRFEFDVRLGVSPVLVYDPPGRVVAKLNPDHTWQKTIYGAWRQETWNASDTVLVSDPTQDAHVGGFFARLPASAYRPTWFEARQNGSLGLREQAAAAKSAVHAETPTIAHRDALGRPFLTISTDRFKHSDAAPLDPPIERAYEGRVRLDIESNIREAVDAKGRAVARYAYDMVGNIIHQSSMDAGERWILKDVTGQGIYSWNSRGQRVRTAYDPLRRATHGFLRDGSSPEALIEHTVYGDSLPTPGRNQRGRVVQFFDQAGVMTSDAYDFKGNVLASGRRLARQYKTTIDWLQDVPLEPEHDVSGSRFDALNRQIEATAPDGSLHRPTFNERGLLASLSVALAGASTTTPIVTGARYNARGQRTRVTYGNGVETAATYDRLTFRPSAVTTTRAGGAALQDFSYVYDAIGNLVSVEDRAQQTIYFGNTVVEPHVEYTYDAVSRLIEATGREHVGQQNEATPTSWDDRFRVRQVHPQDGQAMRRYREQYLYDLAGNIERQVHIAPGGDWTRSYTYDVPSLLEPAMAGNRLHTAITGASIETLRYDVHGNVTQLAHLPAMEWSFTDTLRSAAIGGGSAVYCVCDAGGNRLRKVVERQNGTRLTERIYLGGFERYREFAGNGATVTFARETLHVMAGQERVAIVETRTEGQEAGVPRVLLRHQLGNHNGSACLELDGAAQVIS